MTCWRRSFPEESAPHIAITSLRGGARCSGGPARYAAELGGYEAMLAHHKDLAVTPEQRHRFVSLMSSPPTSRTSRRSGVPLRVARLPGVGDSTRRPQLPTWRQRRRARAGTSLGVGRGSALPAHLRVTQAGLTLTRRRRCGPSPVRAAGRPPASSDRRKQRRATLGGLPPGSPCDGARRGERCARAQPPGPRP